MKKYYQTIEAKNIIITVEQEEAAKALLEKSNTITEEQIAACLEKGMCNFCLGNYFNYIDLPRPITLHEYDGTEEMRAYDNEEAKRMETLGLLPVVYVAKKYDLPIVGHLI